MTTKPDLLRAIADARDAENRRHTDVMDALDGMERSARRLGMIGSSRDASRPARGVGRRVGGVRRAIVEIVEAYPNPIEPPTVLLDLAERGIDTNMANVHQHLGRLVKAGEITRPTRGAYARRLRVAS